MIYSMKNVLLTTLSDRRAFSKNRVLTFDVIIIPKKCCYASMTTADAYCTRTVCIQKMYPAFVYLLIQANKKRNVFVASRFLGTWPYSYISYLSVFSFISTLPERFGRRVWLIDGTTRNKVEQAHKRYELPTRPFSLRQLPPNNQFKSRFHRVCIYIYIHVKRTKE